MKASVQAHRRVLGVSGDVEVLVCGHQVARFDLSEGFRRLVELQRPAYSRVRVCPSCPSEEVTLSVAFSEVPAPPEALLWWAKLSVPERGTWLDQLAAEVDADSLRRTPRSALPAQERDLLGHVLSQAHVEANTFGLTLRELSSCSTRPPPTLSGWALARAAARRYEANSRAG